MSDKLKTNKCMCGELPVSVRQGGGIVDTVFCSNTRCVAFNDHFPTVEAWNEKHPEPEPTSIKIGESTFFTSNSSLIYAVGNLQSRIDQLEGALEASRLTFKLINHEAGDVERDNWPVPQMKIQNISAAAYDKIEALKLKQ